MDDQIAMMIRRYIGTRIKYARDLADINQDALAEAVNGYAPDFEWTRNIVANIERGRREVNLEELCTLAAVQGRSVAWYFADAPDSLRDHIPGLLRDRSNPEASHHSPMARAA